MSRFDGSASAVVSSGTTMDVLVTLNSQLCAERSKL
jgi:hypothetical protein